MSTSISIGLVSDTHGYLPQIVIDCFAGRDLNFIIHAGDSESHNTLSELELIAPTISVLGNCDWQQELQSLPLIARRQLGNARLVITHRPQDLISALNKLGQPEEGTPFIVGIHGHTHVPKFEWWSKSPSTQTMILCPGSPVEPRMDSKPTVAILQIGSDGSGCAPEVEFIEL